MLNRLIASADVVLINMPHHALPAMGLDYASVKAQRKDIILTTINAFGATGPWSERVAFDGVAQAMSGLVYMTGQPGEPMKAYGPWVDFMTGTFAAMGTIAALHWRARSGEGQHVEAPMMLSALVPAMPPRR